MTPDQDYRSSAAEALEMKIRDAMLGRLIDIMIERHGPALERSGTDPRNWAEQDREFSLERGNTAIRAARDAEYSLLVRLVCIPYGAMRDHAASPAIRVATCANLAFGTEPPAEIDEAAFERERERLFGYARLLRRLVRRGVEKQVAIDDPLSRLGVTVDFEQLRPAPIAEMRAGDRIKIDGVEHEITRVERNHRSGVPMFVGSPVDDLAAGQQQEGAEQ